MKVKFKLEPGAFLPFYATSGAAGFDLASYEDVEIFPGDWKAVPTGLYVEIPEGYEMQIRSRSGIAMRQGLILHHGVGTIDCDYRGQIYVPIRNVGNVARVIPFGMKIAQAVVIKAEQFQLVEVEELSDTVRGNGGFGSTGF